MWTIDQECMNEILILRDGIKVASIISDAEESTKEDFDTAQFIVDACNAKEAVQSAE